MQISTAEPRNLPVFIEDLKKMGFEVSEFEGHLGLMIPDKNGFSRIIVSLKTKEYNFYPIGNGIAGYSSSAVAVEKTTNYRTVVKIQDGEISIQELGVSYY